MRAPTGEQYELVRSTPGGEVVAHVTQLAAGLRTLSIGGTDLVEPYPETVGPPSAAGIVLAPWPNRVRDGSWTHIGADGRASVRQLALTEPDRRNAIHGLLRYTAYDLVDKGADFVELSATVFPQPGYPFLVDTRVRYELADDGIAVTHQLANGGTDDAPVAVGTHPYLRIGEVDTAELQLVVNAGTHFEVDERLNPTGEVPVDGGAYELRTPHRVGELTLDDGFGSAGPGELARLTAPNGAALSLWGDDAFRYIQVFTHRAFAMRQPGQVALALEPMTAPANALNSGLGLKWLAPGDTWKVRWGIRYAPAGA